MCQNYTRVEDTDNKKAWHIYIKYALYTSYNI